jgi:PAS fold
MARHQGTVVTVPGIKGAFRMTLADGACWWSPGMFTLHGYRAGRLPRLVPTTRVMVNHVHPADRRATADAWAHLIADGHLVALHYRIVGADGVVRPVFVLASTNHDRANPPTVVTGVMEFDAA